MSFTALAHFAKSLRTSAENSSGVSPEGSVPWFTNEVLKSAEAVARRISPLSRETISLGVPAGANTPYHDTASYPGNPDSATVGTSGAIAVRAALVTASARSFPELIAEAAPKSGVTVICTSLFNTAAICWPAA